MPRKPTQEKTALTVIVDGTPIPITLHPPTGSRKSWYVYWSGLETSKSTRQSNLSEAIKVAENMLRNGGRRSTVADTRLSDEEFLRLQRTHFSGKTSRNAQKRAKRSLEECEDAISAFQELTGLARIADATPDDCARFQREALKRPVNWRRHYPKGKKTDEKLSPNTVLKWSRMLQAAFERANRLAGKKCVRGVVDEKKLLMANPWTQFTWIEEREKTVRHFDAEELRSFLEFLDQNWSGVPVASLAAKMLLWSCCRKSEIAGLRWDDLRLMGSEVHFEVEGKWGVERWFRIPRPLYEGLLTHRCDSPFVFGAYTRQIASVHTDNPGCLRKIKEEFAPRNFGRWVYERVKDWSKTSSNGEADIHVFRKTSLQFAHDGEEDASESVASDAGVSRSVMLKHYVKPKLWRKSNRIYHRILASLPTEIASLYGYAETDRERLQRELEAAQTDGKWGRVAEIANLLQNLDEEPTGSG